LAAAADDSTGPTPIVEMSPRRHRTGSVVAIVAVAAIVFGFTGIALGARVGKSTGERGGAVETSDTGRSTATTSEGVGAGSTLPPGDGRALLARIVPPPVGAIRYAVDDSAEGVMSLTQYVAHYFDGNSAELARLRQQGFQVAASIDYTTPGGLEVTTHLAEFADAGGATQYFQDERSAWQSDARVTGTFDVPATGDGIGFELSDVDALGNRRSVLYEHVGNVMVVVNAYTTGEINEDVDASLLRAQIAALG
jgi:hypothetical protein